LPNFQLPFKRSPRKKTLGFALTLIIDPRLRTHKLKGELAGAWAYSVNHSYRVLFRFLTADEGLYYDIGTHEIYR